MKIRILLTVVLLLLGISQALGQTTGFTYQGKLIDGGAPANGNYDLQFALFDSADGGAQVGQTQTVTAVAVRAGVFTVALDFGANAFPGANRFLEISTRPSGGGAFTVLAPRQVIASTPYAVRSLSSATADKATDATNAINATNATNATTATNATNATNAVTANNAQQLAGVPASQYVLTGDARLSDSRTPTAGSASYIQNTTNQQTSSNFNISGDGTAGGTISGNVMNAVTQYNIGGQRVLGVQSASQNTFLGLSAGAHQTNGTQNSFFGNSAGLNNSAGSYNSFFGNQAGINNTTGYGNIFFGYQSGKANTTGYGNVLVGDQAGAANTTGTFLTAIGDGAGFSNTTEYGNTYLGSDADGVPGIENATAIGTSAKVTQSNSLVLGSINGVNQASADTNVGIGTTAPSARLHVNGNTLLNGDVNVGVSPSFSQFKANASGSFMGNLAVGTDLTWPPPLGHLVHVQGLEAALRLDATGSTAALPWEWRSTLNGKMNLSNLRDGNTALTILPNGNVGIDTTTPTLKLTVNGDGWVEGTMNANQYNLVGRQVLRFNGDTLHLSDANNVGIGASSDTGYQLEVVSPNNKGLRVGTLQPGGRALSVGGFGDVQIDSNGTPGGRLIITEGGNVGIGRTNPLAKLDVGGTILVATLGQGGNVQLCWNNSNDLISVCSSSLRYKTDLHPFTGGLDLINRLHPITFKWKSDQSRDLGFGAEDVAAVEPLLVTRNRDGQVEGVKYDRLSAVFVNAFKEQQNQIAEQHDQIKSLMAANAQLSARLQTVEQRLARRAATRRR